ncbi:Vacuolar H+-ATPase V1 sector, subunit C [Trachipleistophora hominis]|uniref:V-type proton ATPase subunit C n=1 Tax=Trachipleistophora hominis TaxID=72359 RepID=L7JW08_TRAHO|nr:Vacuolar H+-ATPase V1 sector, subunit C [Trachipleistophora hominis]
MYFFISLPVDSRTSAINLLTHLKKHRLDVFKLNVPINHWSSFGSMIELTEQLDGLCRQVLDLFNKLLTVDRDFVKSPSFVKNVDLNNKIERFVWPGDKYPRAALNDMFETFVDELALIRKNFELRSANYERSKRKMEDIRRRKNGTLREVDLANLVTQNDDFEFLEYFYVLIDRNERLENVDVEDLICVKEIAGDEEQRLVQCLGLRSKREHIEKQLAAKKYIVKRFESTNEDVDRIAIDFSVVEKGYFTFIDTYLLETFDLLLCVKLTKLYVDSVLQYGLPNSYIFLGSKDKSMDNVVRRWIKALKNFDFGNRVVDYKAFDERVAYNSVEEVLVDGNQ